MKKTTDIATASKRFPLTWKVTM